LQSANYAFDKGSRPAQLITQNIETVIDEIIYNAESDKSLKLIAANQNTLDAT